MKLSDTFAIQPHWDNLSVEAFATHVAAMCDCAQKLTDGHLTERAVRRLPIVDDPMAAAEELVTAGLWEKTAAGFRIVDYLVDQEEARVVQERVEAKRRWDREWQRDKLRAPNGVPVKEWRAKQAAEAGLAMADWLDAQRRGTDARAALVRASYEGASTSSREARTSRPDPATPDPATPDPEGEGVELAGPKSKSLHWRELPPAGQPRSTADIERARRGADAARGAITVKPGVEEVGVA